MQRLGCIFPKQGGAMISVRCSDERGGAILALQDCLAIPAESRRERIKQKATLSAFTLLGSLAAYYFAKSTGSDVVPAAMVGGYVGSLIGEFLASGKPSAEAQRNTASGNENS
jgi:hypothetical protein